MMSNQIWIEQAYPLQQITIRLQGTKHSDRDDVVNQLEKVLVRLRAGEKSGADHDDDFGYSFECVVSEAGPSFFEEACESR